MGCEGPCIAALVGVRVGVRVRVRVRLSRAPPLGDVAPGSLPPRGYLQPPPRPGCGTPAVGRWRAEGVWAGGLWLRAGGGRRAVGDWAVPRGCATHLGARRVRACQGVAGIPPECEKVPAELPTGGGACHTSVPAELPQLVGVPHPIGVPHPTPTGGELPAELTTILASSWERTVSTVRVRLRAQVKVRARVG
eukprot:scaffold123141_cov36-Phaeocystis_antarctica.AAC.2